MTCYILTHLHLSYLVPYLIPTYSTPYTYTYPITPLSIAIPTNGAILYGCHPSLLIGIGYLGILSPSPPSIIHYTTYVYMSSGGGYYSCSPLTIIHYTTYVYMSCQGTTYYYWYLHATIGIQTIGVYL